MAAYGDVSYEGLHGEYTSMPSNLTYSGSVANGHADVGKAMTIGQGTDPNAVQTCADAQAVAGKLILLEADGIANVQTGGYAKFAYTGVTSAALGKKIVGGAAGEVRVPVAATVAETSIARGQIVYYGTNYVWVRL